MPVGALGQYKGFGTRKKTVTGADGTVETVLVDPGHDLPKTISPRRPRTGPVTSMAVWRRAEILAPWRCTSKWFTLEEEGAE